MVPWLVVLVISTPSLYHFNSIGAIVVVPVTCTTLDFKKIVGVVELNTVIVLAVPVDVTVVTVGTVVGAVPVVTVTVLLFAGQNPV